MQFPQKIEVKFPKRLSPSERVVAEAALCRAAAGKSMGWVRRSTRNGSTHYTLWSLQPEQVFQVFQSPEWAREAVDFLYRGYVKGMSEAGDREIFLLRLGVNEFTFEGVGTPSVYSEPFER